MPRKQIKREPLIPLQPRYNDHQVAKRVRARIDDLPSLMDYTKKKAAIDKIIAEEMPS